jgi:hypothetical protein
LDRSADSLFLNLFGATRLNVIAAPGQLKRSMALSPTKWKRSTLLSVIGLLIGVPLVIAYFYASAVMKQDRRDDELFQKYDCFPPDKCAADFNGDGIKDSIVLTDREVVAQVGGRDVWRAPFDYIDGTFRTHVAVNEMSGKSILLIYDGVNHHPPMSAAYAWDGSKLQSATASNLDWDILSAMARHDDTGGWNERAFRPLLRAAQLFVYYFALAIIIAGVLFKRYRARVARFG